LWGRAAGSGGAPCGAGRPEGVGRLVGPGGRKGWGALWGQAAGRGGASCGPGGRKEGGAPAGAKQGARRHSSSASRRKAGSQSCRLPPLFMSISRRKSGSQHALVGRQHAHIKEPAWLSAAPCRSPAATVGAYLTSLANQRSTLVVTTSTIEATAIWEGGLPFGATYLGGGARPSALLLVGRRPHVIVSRPAIVRLRLAFSIDMLVLVQ
jgi:hypothetical protein